MDGERGCKCGRDFMFRGQLCFSFLCKLCPNIGRHRRQCQTLLAATHCLVIDDLAPFKCTKMHNISRREARSRRHLSGVFSASWSSTRYLKHVGQRDGVLKSLLPMIPGGKMSPGGLSGTVVHGLSMKAVAINFELFTCCLFIFLCFVGSTFPP